MEQLILLALLQSVFNRMLKPENPAPLVIENLGKLFHAAVVLLSEQEILLLLRDAFVNEEIIVVLGYLKVAGKHRSHARPLLQFLELPSKTHQILPHDQCFLNVRPFADFFDFVYFARDSFHVVFEDELKSERIDIR